MWDEEPGRQGASAIDSRCAREESSVLSGGRTQQEVALDAHGYPQPVRQRLGRRTTGRRVGRASVVTPSNAQQLQHAQRWDRGACLAQAERQMRGAACGGRPGSSRGTQPDDESHIHGNGIVFAGVKGVVISAISLLRGCVVWLPERVFSSVCQPPSDFAW